MVVLLTDNLSSSLSVSSGFFRMLVKQHHCLANLTALQEISIKNWELERLQKE